MPVAIPESSTLIQAIKIINDRLRVGTGTPETNETADVGTLFLRTDGGTSTTFYVKETGTGNTGWVAK